MVQTTIVALSALATIACNKGAFEPPQFTPSGFRSNGNDTDFAAANDGTAKGDDAAGPADGGKKGDKGKKKGDKNDLDIGPPANTSPGPNDGLFAGASNELVDCADQQHVLIIDLKSGWWEGDGANTFSQVIEDSLLGACAENVVVSIEYHHIIAGSKTKRFWKEPYFEQYTQVWILSGSEADADDIKLTDPRFKEMIDELQRSYANIFLGGGFGSIDHGNAVAKALLGESVFTTPSKSGDILEVAADGTNITVNTHFTPEDLNAGLFTGIENAVADSVTVGGKVAQSDQIASGSVKVLASCDNGPCIGLVKVPQHNIVMDAGLQRFYAMYLAGEEPNLRQYLGNIVRALSK